MKIRTHYDNLKVSRDAPPEVIRAAYKSLSQKYHPDRNPGDEAAARIMQLLNEAYEVLSDTRRRALHNQWIAFHEAADVQSRGSAQFSEPQGRHHSAPVAPPEDPQPRKQRSRILAVLLFPIGVILHVASNLRFYIVAGPLIWLGAFIVLEYSGYKAKPEHTLLSPAIGRKVSEEVEREARASAEAKAKAKAQFAGQTSKPAAAPAAPAIPMCSPAIHKGPNGAPWPARAGYVAPITHTAGYSTITIDNSEGGVDIWAKLARPGDTKTAGIREAYIPKGSTFTMNKIEPGAYVVKYKDVATGCNSLSDPFSIEQVEEYSGIRYSQLTLTIYRVLNGNMNFDRLPEANF